MSFPTTSVLDNFDRANGALGANWGAPLASGDSTPTVWTNAAVSADAAYGTAYWSAATYLECEVYATFTHDSACFLWARTHDPNSGGLDTVYAIFHIDTDTVEIYADVNGSTVWTPTSITGLTLVSGDQFGMTVKNVGNDIVVEVFQNGTSIGTRTLTDGVTTYAASIAAAGNIGFGLYGGGNTLTRSVDNFGGGTIVTLTLDSCLPDADITTTGWSTAPLYSKVNDSSDATVITATAS